MCWQLASRIRTDLQFRPDPARKLSAIPVWHIPLLCVQWTTPVDGQRNCPKHVEFYSKNKFEKLVHVVGFIIRIYYEARSPERQIQWSLYRYVFTKEWMVFGTVSWQWIDYNRMTPYRVTELGGGTAGSNPRYQWISPLLIFSVWRKYSNVF